jgi:hypothetical protein
MKNYIGVPVNRNTGVCAPEFYFESEKDENAIETARKITKLGEYPKTWFIFVLEVNVGEKRKRFGDIAQKAKTEAVRKACPLFSIKL